MRQQALLWVLVHFDAAHTQPLTTDRSHSRPTLQVWPLLKRMQAEPVRDYRVVLGTNLDTSQGDAEALSKYMNSNTKEGTPRTGLSVQQHAHRWQKGHDWKCIRPCPHGSPARQHMLQRAPGSSHVVQLQRMVLTPCPKDLLPKCLMFRNKSKGYIQQEEDCSKRATIACTPKLCAPKRDQEEGPGKEGSLHYTKRRRGHPAHNGFRPRPHPSDCPPPCSACPECPNLGLSHGTLQGARRSRGAARKGPRPASSGTGMRACQMRQSLSCSVRRQAVVHASAGLSQPAQTLGCTPVRKSTYAYRYQEHAAQKQLNFTLRRSSGAEAVNNVFGISELNINAKTRTQNTGAAARAREVLEEQVVVGGEGLDVWPRARVGAERAVRLEERVAQQDVLVVLVAEDAVHRRHVALAAPVHAHASVRAPCMCHLWLALLRARRD